MERGGGQGWWRGEDGGGGSGEAVLQHTVPEEAKEGINEWQHLYLPGFCHRDQLQPWLLMPSGKLCLC